MTKWISLALALVMCACSGSKEEPVPADGGTEEGPIDDSCGIDCAAQGRYGLIVQRCFEYSDSATGQVQEPAALGVKVLPVEELEGGVKVIPVQYHSSGQVRMTDRFNFTGGDLVLVRRSFTNPAGSVSYQNAEGALTGVVWVKRGAAPPNSYTSNATAVIVGDIGTAGSTSFRVNLQQATEEKLTVPADTAREGLELLMVETPDHGTDPRRYFVENVGFVRFSSDFSPATGTATDYQLQAVRDLQPNDTECGL